MSEPTRDLPTTGAGSGTDDAVEQTPISSTAMVIASAVTAIAVLAATVLSISLSRGADELTVEAARATLRQAQISAPADGENASPSTESDGTVSSITTPTPLPEAAVAVPTSVPPTVEPTTPPPTATPPPAPTPTPTPPPTPTPTPVPIPTPLPTAAPQTFEPITVPAGRSSVPLGQTVSFELDAPRPAQILPGHVAIYLDDTYGGEVDLFVPFATTDGDRLFGFDDVIDHIESDPEFVPLVRFNEIDLRGQRMIGYAGSPAELEVGFYTAPGTTGLANAGWRFPGRLVLWVVDSPYGPIAITGETLLANADRADEAEALLTEILDSVEFHAS